MRKTLLVVLILFFVSTLSAEDRTISPSKKKLIQELLKLSYASEMSAEFMINVAGTAMGQLPSDADELMEWRKSAQESPEMKQMLEKAYIEIYDQRFTEAQLKNLIVFFKSDLGRKFAEAQLVSAMIGRYRLLDSVEADLKEAKVGVPIKRTMADMRSLATASEAYATDYNAYPKAKNLSELAKLLSPVYIRTLPMKDGWGNEFIYLTTADQQEYRVISGGPDGKVSKGNMTIKSKPQGDDIIFELGLFIQEPTGTANH